MLDICVPRGRRGVLASSAFEFRRRSARLNGFCRFAGTVVRRWNESMGIYDFSGVGGCFCSAGYEGGVVSVYCWEMRGE